MFQIRAATSKDVSTLSELLEMYMQETFRQPWRGSPEAIERDGFGVEFETIVAETSKGELIGFAAWALSYDLHHCIRGGEIIDMFVNAEYRGRGVAAALLAAVAAAVHRKEGKYLKGQAVENAVSRRLYARVAVSFPGADYIVGGRAFRKLAELAGRRVRAIIHGLPQKEWNYDP